MGQPPRELGSDEQGEGPRIRDVPAPRRNRSLAGSFVGWALSWPYRALLAGLFRLRIRPWHLTVASLVLMAAAAWLVLVGELLAAGILVLLAGMCDVFDGGLARLRGEEGRSGAFLDSVIDRISDMLIFGALFWRLSEEGERLGAGLALATLVVSLLVSHLRAEAEAAGVSLSEGVFQRLERILGLAIGLLVPGALVPVLAVLAALGSVTVIQRAWSAGRRLADRSGTAGPAELHPGEPSS